MSKSESPTPEDIYERHGEAVEEIANRDDIMGAAARAVLEVASEDDE